MKKIYILTNFLFIIVVLWLSGISCSKGSGGGPAPDPCAGVTITVTATVTNPTTSTATNGSIVASASGGSGLMYSINNGPFQASGLFNGLVAGTYTITARSGSNCTGSAVFSLSSASVCGGVTITVSTMITNTIPCETAAVGMINISTSGGAGPFTYSVNGGAFQSSNTFNNLAAANYTVTAKDANGCTGSTTATVANVAAGPLFSAVKSLIQTNCVSCHNASTPNGGMDWTVDCNIVMFKDRIKARAVDGNPSPMPEGGLLPVAERQKITDWINAGGKFNN